MTSAHTESRKEQTMSRLMIVEVPSYSCEFKGIREICELVRCKECKHWWVDGGNMLCHIHCDPTVPEHFCSYGEREGE